MLLLSIKENSVAGNLADQGEKQECKERKNYLGSSMLTKIMLALGQCRTESLSKGWREEEGADQEGEEGTAKGTSQFAAAQTFSH